MVRREWSEPTRVIVSLVRLGPTGIFDGSRSRLSSSRTDYKLPAMNTPARKPRPTHGAQPIRLQPRSRWTLRNLLLFGLVLGALSALVGVLEQVKVRFLTVRDSGTTANAG